jgi:hypothetical protein
MSHCFSLSKKSGRDSYLCNVQNKQNVKSHAWYSDPCLRVLSCAGSNPVTKKRLHCLITRKTTTTGSKYVVACIPVLIKTCAHIPCTCTRTPAPAWCLLSIAAFYGAGMWLGLQPCECTKYCLIMAVVLPPLCRMLYMLCRQATVTEIHDFARSSCTTIGMR